MTGDVSTTVKSVTLANAGLTFQVLTNLTVTATNGLNFSAGVISGPGGLNLGGTNTWSGGSLNSASRVTVANGANFTISGIGDHDLPGVSLTNNGTIRHTGGNVRGGLGSVIHNAGTWLEQVDADINADYGGGPLTFNNGGTFRKTVGAGSTRFLSGVLLNNSGLVDAQSGTIESNGGGTSGGTFNAAAGAGCNFTASHTFGAGARFTGAGASWLAAGTMIFSGAITSENLQWNAGTMAGTLTVSAASTLLINTLADHDMPGATLNNNGTVIHTGGSIRGGLGGMINNAGTWLAQAIRTLTPITAATL